MKDDVNNLSPPTLKVIEYW